MKHIKLLLFLTLLISASANAQGVKVSVDKLKIPTYVEPAREELPMFAENRVHQRSSGNPYPNKIVQKVNRESKIDKEYTVITLENEFLELQILPEIGGKIYSAKDKTNGYDFFYKNHVIKPALIGALGSWISGGLEFNWPFHHRASSFMPTDYEIEKLQNGGVIVWVAEHDPTDRMKGMVGIVLNPGESIFETRVKLSNTTPFRNSFLWWENVAVPSNKDYEVFFPHDVSHVLFHYKRSITTYPVATNAAGIFNGIKYDGAVDISQHKNTIQPTSYFSAASKYDYFGGYDAGKKCGVVHIADHHVSPGKKMFTWAYNQLSTSWENALTDTDGAYCELMAGSYSDNQPDFSWLEPMETKIFSQYWFPIGEIGVPDFANTVGAIYVKDKVKVQLNKNADVKIVIKEGDEILFNEQSKLKAREEYVLPVDIEMTPGHSIEVLSADGVKLMAYAVLKHDTFNIPHTTQDMPNIDKVESPHQLYLEGVHVAQYRDPAINGESYYREAIERDPNFAPALIALGEIEFRNAFYQKALKHLSRAESVLTQFNKRLESGKLYYLLGHTHLALEDEQKAYDYFQKAAWCNDHISVAMTYISLLDIANEEYSKATQHLNTAITYQQNNAMANALMIYAKYLNGDKKGAKSQYLLVDKNDKLNHLARYFGVVTGNLAAKDFMGAIKTDKNQVCLDLAETLLIADLSDETASLIEMLKAEEPLVFSLSAIYADIKGCTPDDSTVEGIAFPSRGVELKSLSGWADKGNDKAKFQLGCALYDKGHHAAAATLWESMKKEDYRSVRNLAVAAYSHLDKKDEVLPLLEKAMSLQAGDEQLIFETVYVMGKLGVDPAERLAFLNKYKDVITRDDIMLEWARAYNMAAAEDDALELLMGRNFIPAEGGEHAVAEQYMMAYFLKGRKLMEQGKAKEAAECFKAAQTLPQNLGAGIWNIVRLVPYKYYEAICLKSLGENEKAQENFDFITGIEVDYFSNMNLPELPVYHALCYREMGMPLEGDMIINYKAQEWQNGLNTVDAGYFGTTPFFISYCDTAAQQRSAYFNYLLALAYQYMGKDELSAKAIEQAAASDPYALNIFAQRKFGVTKN